MVSRVRNVREAVRERTDGTADETTTPAIRSSRKALPFKRQNNP